MNKQADASSSSWLPQIAIGAFVLVLIAMILVQRACARNTVIERVTDEEMQPLLNDRAVIERGGQLFRANCAGCHGSSGSGGIGANLLDQTWLHGGRPSQVFHSIAAGVPTRGMPAWNGTLDGVAIRSLTAYVLTLSRDASSTSH